MLFWIFLVHCSSRITIIFLIVSKEIQKYDQRKFYFFQKRNISKFGIHVHHWKKKIAKKTYNFFSVQKNCKTKKFAISKISDEKIRKIHYFANIKYQYRNICEKKNFRQKKFDKKNCHQKQICRKKFS